MIVAASLTRRRAGYTLLEVMLASAIALFVLIALYMFMEVSLRQASEGREVVERATLARGIINRIHNDLTPSITAPAAKPKSRSTSGSNQGTQSSNQSTNTGMGTTTAPGTATGTTSETGTETETETIAEPISLQAGVIGTADYVTIYTTRVPDPNYAGTANGGEETDAPVPSDIRRIVYWIGESGGLCRQEIPWVTGENVYNVEGPVIEADKSERDYVIAPEVIALSFEYYDINSTTDDGGWVTEWDGRTPGPDELTPMGPPTAIRVSFTIKFKNARGEDSTKDYRHVIPILTASGPSSTEELQSPDASDTTTGTTSGTTTTTTTPTTTTPTGR